MKDLSLCIFTSDLKSAKVLLDAGADINRKNSIGIYPIISAINSNHPSTLEFAIMNGADVNIDHGRPLLEVIDCCIDGMIQNNLDKPYLESLKMLKILLNNGANLEIRNENGERPIDVISNYGKTSESLKKLKSIFRPLIPKIDELLKQ